jgi:hypothetical protein
MSNVLNRTTCQYLQSVNTPDYPETDWISDPDLTAVEGVAQKYWKIEGDSVVPMTPEEQAQVNGAAVPAMIASRIRGAMDYGKNLMVDYGTKNVLAGKTVDQIRLISTKLGEIQTLLLSGSLYCAYQAISQTTPDENVTQADKDDFLAKLGAYLGI